MSQSLAGILLVLAFVALESAQFVYFGGLFQDLNLFYFGFWVFALIAVICIGTTAIKNPGQIVNALANRAALIGINVCAVFALTAYLLSVQLVEPAITYTVSSGTMPLTAYILHRLNFSDGVGLRNSFEKWGALIILGSILFLGTVTVFGMTGFVRGGWFSGLLGVLLAVVDGIFFTLIMVFSKKLNHAGVHTTAVLGLRLPLYVFFTAALAGLTWGEGTHHSPGDMVRFVCLGVLLTLPPLYLVQKAVPMVSTLTLSSVTALGPLFVLAMQLLEGRVEYKHVTSLGLVIYMVGAMFAAYGSAIGDTRKASSSA